MKGEFGPDLKPVTWVWKKEGSWTLTPTIYVPEKKVEFVGPNMQGTYLITVTFDFLRKDGKNIFRITECGWKNSDLRAAFMMCEGWTAVSHLSESISADRQGCHEKGIGTKREIPNKNSKKGGSTGSRRKNLKSLLKQLITAKIGGGHLQMLLSSLKRPTESASVSSTDVQSFRPLRLERNESG